MKDLKIETVVERRLGFTTIYLKRLRTGLTTCFDVDLIESQALIRTLQETQEELKQATQQRATGTNPCLAVDADLHVDWKGRFERVLSLIVEIDWNMSDLDCPGRQDLNEAWDQMVSEGRALLGIPAGRGTKEIE